MRREGGRGGGEGGRRWRPSGGYGIYRARNRQTDKQLDRETDRKKDRTGYGRTGQAKIGLWVASFNTAVFDFVCTHSFSINVPEHHTDI